MAEAVNRLISTLEALQSPDVLDPKQNILDQNPFRNVIADEFTRDELDKHILSYVLIRYASTYRSYLGEEDEVSQMMQTVPEKGAKEIAKSKSQYLNELNSDQRGLIPGALNRMVAGLGDYLFWYEYLANRAGPGMIYQSDGTPVEGRTNQVPSYKGWIPSRVRSRINSHTFLEAVNEFHLAGRHR